MNKRKIINIVAVLLVLAISFGLVLTNAKYTSTVNGQVTASVAQYVFEVTGNDSYNSNSTLENLVLAQTCDETTLVDGKIAPGTSGEFEIVIDTTGSEVGIGYEVIFANTSANELPTNLVFNLDGETWNISDGITGVINANSGKRIAHTISWEWQYETIGEDDTTTAGDIADTADGVNGFDYSFTITATGTQVKPIAK